MLVLVKQTCTLLVAACVGTCFAQAAAALELNSLTPRRRRSKNRIGLAFISAPILATVIRGRRLRPRSDSHRRAPSRRQPTRSWLQFPVRKFRVRPRRLAGGGQLRRPIHRAVSAGDDGRRLVAEHELARHRDRQVRLFVRPVAALCQGRLRCRRRRFAVAGRRQLGCVFARRRATGGWTAGAGFEYQITPKLVFGA